MTEAKRQRLLVRVRATEDVVQRLAADLPPELHACLDDALIALDKLRERLEREQ